MEMPIRLVHLKLWRIKKDESCGDYFKRFHALSAQMKETPDIKEITKICSMKHVLLHGTTAVPLAAILRRCTRR